MGGVSFDEIDAALLRGFAQDQGREAEIIIGCRATISVLRKSSMARRCLVLVTKAR